MKMTLLVSTILLSSGAFIAPAVAGTSGGGVGMKKEQLMELMEVSRGASVLSAEFYGTPDNFVLDAKNRKVTFEKSFEMSFEEVKDSAPAVEIPEQPAESAATAN